MVFFSEGVQRVNGSCIRRITNLKGAVLHQYRCKFHLFYSRNVRDVLSMQDAHFRINMGL